MVAAGVAVAGNLAQGNWKGALASAVGFIPGGKALSLVASMSKVGTKAMTRVMSVQARMPGLGVRSRLFGSSAFSRREGLLNRSGFILKAGWSRDGGRTVFRYGAGKAQYYNTSRRKVVARSYYHVDMR